MRIPDLDTGLPAVLSASNGMTFGTTGASVTGAPSPNISAGTTSNNVTAVTFSNSNNMSFGLNASTITASYGLNISAGTTSRSLSAVTLSGNTNLNATHFFFGLNGSTVTAASATYSSFEPFNLVATQTQTFNGASVSYALAFRLPLAISASFIRFPVLMTTNSTTLATVAAQNVSVQLATTFNAVFYSLGTGANSKSLQSVASGSAGFTILNSSSGAAQASRWSASLQFTFQREGISSSTSTSYAASTSNFSLVTTGFHSNFTTLRWIDIPFACTLSRGPYWLVIGMSTSSTTNSTGMSAGSNCFVNYSNHYGVSQANSHWGVMGSTNLTSGGLEGAGSFSTAGGGTTNSIPISAISSVASEIRPYFQLISTKTA